VESNAEEFQISEAEMDDGTRILCTHFKEYECSISSQGNTIEHSPLKTRGTHTRS